MYTVSDERDSVLQTAVPLQFGECTCKTRSGVRDKGSKDANYMETVLTAGPSLPGRPGAPCSPCKPRGPGEPRGPSMPGSPRLPSGPREPGSPGLPTCQIKRVNSVECCASDRLILAYQNGDRSCSQM